MSISGPLIPVCVDECRILNDGNGVWDGEASDHSTSLTPVSGSAPAALHLILPEEFH